MRAGNDTGGVAERVRPRLGRCRAPHWLLLASLACAGAPARPPQPAPASAPKYPASTAPLSRDHGYLQRAAAPDFWALIPYYVPQQSDAACSLASLAMLVNAARHPAALGSDESLVTQPLLLERVHDEGWRHGVSTGGEGVTLGELAVLASESLAAFALRPARVEVTHVPEASPAALERLRQLLRDSETSARDYLLFNFDAKSYVGVGDYGHIAPVAAYDAEQQRVLVLDPDRTWYEPYWIPDHVALEGMATRDPVSGQPRGYLYVALR